MPAPGKRPDEPGPCDLVGAGAPWPTRTGLGVFAARGRRAGGQPRDPARPGSVRGLGRSPATGPASLPRGPGASRSWRWRSASRGRGRDRAERVGVSMAAECERPSR